MDPATIGILSTLITFIVGVTGAGIIACCRSQKNEATQQVKDSSTDAVIVNGGGSEETITNYDGQGRVTSVTIKKQQPTTVTIKADDIGAHGAGASNVIKGYDHNSLESAVSQQGRPTPSGVGAVAAAAIVTNPPTRTDITAASQPESRPPEIDVKSVIHPVPAQRSTLGVGELNIKNGDLSIVIKGFSSQDIRSAPFLESHLDTHNVDSMGSVNHDVSQHSEA